MFPSALMFPGTLTYPGSGMVPGGFGHGLGIAQFVNRNDATATVRLKQATAVLSQKTLRVRTVLLDHTRE
jgi:hypothetical protein